MQDGEEAFEAAGAFFESAGAVSGEPELAEFGDEGLQFGGELLSCLGGDFGGFDVSGLQAGDADVACEPHQCGAHLEFFCDEIGVGSFHLCFGQWGHDLVDVVDGFLEAVDGQFFVQRFVDAVGQHCVEDGAVSGHDAADFVGVSEVIGEFSHDAGAVLEGVYVQEMGDCGVFIGVAGPTERGAICESEVGGGEELPVSAIAPVGDEESDGAVCPAVFGGVSQVSDGVVGASDEGVPGGGARDDIEWDFRFGEFFAVGGEGVLSFVSPFHGGDIFGEFGDEFGVLHDDVAPELHGAALLLEEFVYFE